MPAESSSGPAVGSSSSSSATRAPTKKPSSESSKQKNELYEQCVLKQPIGHAFSFAELGSFGIVSTDDELLDLTDSLISTHEFILCKNTESGEAMWKTRDREQARMYGD